MKTTVLHILFVCLMLLVSSVMLCAQGTLTTKIISPASPICEGTPLQIELTSSSNMLNVGALKIKFYKAGILKDSSILSTTFNESPYKKDTQFVTIPTSILGSNVTARAYFMTDSPAWIFVQTAPVTIYQTPTISSAASKVICNYTNLGYTITSATSGTTYSWTAFELSPPSFGHITGFGNCASGCGSFINDNLNNSGNSSGVVRYVITPTGPAPNFCPGSPFNLDVTVNPVGHVNQPSNQVVCNNNITSNVAFSTGDTGGVTTFSWINDESSIGLASSGSGNNLPSFNAINHGTSPVIAHIIVTPTYTDGTVLCDGPSKSFTITVLPDAQMNQPLNQTRCNNTSTSQVIFTTPNSGVPITYNWTNDTPSIGLSSTGSGFSIPSFIAGNNGVNPVTATIVVTPVFTIGSTSCSGNSKTFTITVNPSGQVNQTSNQYVCHAGNTLPVLFSTNRSGGTTTYSWTNDSPSIGLASNGSGNIASFTPSNTGTSPVTANIVVTPVFANGAPLCSGLSKTVKIIVNPDAQVNQPANQVWCHNNTTFATSFSTNRTGGITTYSWTNDMPSIGLASGGTGSIPSFVTINNGTTPLIATITVTPTFTNGGASCDGPSKIFTITVNPTPQVNQPSDQILCNHSNTTAIQFGTINTMGITSYSWTNNNPGIGLGSNGIGDIPSFTAINTDRVPVTAVIVVTPTFTFGTTSCQGPSKTFTITVHPTPVAFMLAGADTILSGSDTICSHTIVSCFISTDTSMLVSSAMNGLYWSVGVNPLLEGSTQLMSGNRISMFSNTLKNMDQANQIQSIEYTFFPVSKDGCAPSSPIKDTLYVRPHVLFESSDVIQNIPVCSGWTNDTIKLNIPPNSFYTYHVLGDTSVHGYNMLSIPSSSSFIADTLVSTNHTSTSAIYYILRFEANDQSGCPVEYDTIQKIVKPTPLMTSTPVELCSQAIGTFSFTPTMAIDSSVWKIDSLQNLFGYGSSTGIGVGTVTTLTANTKSETLSNISDNNDIAMDGRVSYHIKLFANGCSSDDSIKGTVHALPNLNVTAIAPICHEDTALIILNSSTGDSTFTWTHHSFLVSGSSDNMMNPNDTIQYKLFNTDPANFNTGYDTFFVKPISGYGCIGPDSAIIQEVNPTPKIISSLTDTSICSGATLNRSLMSSTTGVSNFFWQVIHIDQGLYIDPLVNTTSTMTQTIIDSLNNSSLLVYWDSIHVTSAFSCYSDTTFKITVHPIPMFDTATVTAICSGNFTNITLGSTSDNNSYYTWYPSGTNPSIVGAHSNSSKHTFIQDSLVSINHNSSESIQYKLQVTSNFGCSDTSASSTGVSDTVITQLIHPVPQLKGVAEAIICSRESLNYIPQSTTAGVSTYTWGLLNSNGFKTLNSNASLTDSNLVGNGVILESYQSDALLPVKTQVDTVIYLYTIQSDQHCRNTQQDAVGGDTVRVIIKPTPNPFVHFSQADSIGLSLYCTNTEHRLFEFGRPVVPGEQINWSFSNPNGTHIYEPRDPNSNRVLIKSDSAKLLVLSSSFGSFGECHIDTTVDVSATSASSRNPRLILKSHHNQQTNATDSVLICLANANYLDSTFRYRWGRIDKQTLQENKVWDMEHGQEYLFNPLEHDNSGDYFYWAEIKWKGDPCIRRVYLADQELKNTIQENEESISDEFEMKLYPNPAHSVFNISFEGIASVDGYEIELLDMTGRSVQKHKMYSGSSSFSISELSNGLYLLVCSFEGAKVASQKLIKQ